MASQRSQEIRGVCRLLSIGVLAMTAGPCVAQGDLSSCRREADDARRLACYDAALGTEFDRSGIDPAVPTAALGLRSAAVDAERPTRPAASPAPGQDEMLAAVAGETWELGPEAKRGTFIVRTYQPNFVLPAHWTSSVNLAPSTPTRGTAPSALRYKSANAKIQISLRTKVVEGLLLPQADLWFAYTQRSLWQFWDTQQSSPFRSTDYQPEAIYVIPTPRPLAPLWAGWHWRMTQLGLMHQSNGQSGALSRSWNRVYAAASVDRGELGLVLRVFRRLNDGSNDDNPDIARYVGDAELAAAWLPGLATAQVTWRTRLASAGRGSIQWDLTYPVDRGRPQGLRWYVQVFSGYGESLLDYNHRQTSVGTGLTLFQF
ncbi:MAG: phospholipase [Burkholderiaceae bacterium]|nr:MAG: phospholipase [Burkholderiaceae bacterium]